VSDILVAKPAQADAEGATVRILSGAEARRARLALAEILADCVTGGASVSFMWPFTIDDAHEWWGGVIEAVSEDRTVLFAAHLDDRLVGTVQLGLDVPPNQPHRGDVKKLLVHREARCRGIGAALMGALEAEAGRRGLSLLTLDTASGSAERLYQRLGWVKAGVIPRYALWPGGRYCDTTIYWKALSAE
jgi:ribosomal protein S18 acetylase RimI-like enzyme